ncbi:hypothetical protein L9F63_024812 [Diploptera punctata]|uniref:Uncharacterized protein n=1 Tax=Diploptera punctata TaxID=6984 RepID=A0AAD7ZEL3_DIPPU|nr:hypothetical protein L9F63_024812 [Diploptera punctata]
MEKFVWDLDKVLDEFEFSEDRAEQFASILAKKNSSITPVPPVAGDNVLHQSTPTYRRPAFEPINLADADFAADLQISAPCYNSTLSSAAKSFPGAPRSEANIYMSHSENINRNNENRLNNDASIDCHNSQLEWHSNVTSNLCSHGRLDVTAVEPNSGGMHDRLESTTNKINVSGVFSSLNEYINAGNIETKLGDANPSCRTVELEEDANSSKRYVGSTIMNNQSSLLCPKTISEQNVEIEKLGKNISIDNLWENNNEVRLTDNKWADTIDVCKVSENSSKNSFADLISSTYSKSLQENVRDIASASSEETPDLLDRTVISNKSNNFVALKNVGEGDSIESENIYSSDVKNEDFTSESSSQPNLSLLPDVASSGRSAFNANMRSDLIASHSAAECSDNEITDAKVLEDSTSQ